MRLYHQIPNSKVSNRTASRERLIRSQYEGNQSYVSRLAKRPAKDVEMQLLHFLGLAGDRHDCSIQASSIQAPSSTDSIIDVNSQLDQAVANAIMGLCSNEQSVLAQSLSCLFDQHFENSETKDWTLAWIRGGALEVRLKPLYPPLLFAL